MTTIESVERLILSTIMLEGPRALQTMPDLTTDDFDAGAYRDVLAACLRLDQDDELISFPTVGAELVGNSRAVGVLSTLYESEPTVVHLPNHLRRLRQLRALGRAVVSARQIVGEATSTELLEGKLDRIRELAQRIIDDSGERSGGNLISIREVADTENALRAAIREGRVEPKRIPTGIWDLDRLLVGDGFDLGSLVVIGGPTSSGKSSLAAQIAVGAAKRSHPVVFVTAEMSHRQMLARLAAASTMTPLGDLIDERRSAESTTAEWAIEQVGSLPIDFQRRFPPTAEEAMLAIRQARARHGVELAVIDYAQRLARLEDDLQHRAIAQVITAGKNLALELNIVVIAVAQTNRSSTERRRKLDELRPRLSDFAGSAQIERDSDYALMVFRPSQYGLPAPDEICVKKQRNGPTGNIEVQFHGETTRFEGIERREYAREEL